MRWLTCVVTLAACSPGSPGEACEASDGDLLAYVSEQVNADGTERPGMVEVFSLCGERIAALLAD